MCDQEAKGWGQGETQGWAGRDPGPGQGPWGGHSLASSSVCPLLGRPQKSLNYHVPLGLSLTPEQLWAVSAGSGEPYRRLVLVIFVPRGHTHRRLVAWTR